MSATTDVKKQKRATPAVPRAKKSSSAEGASAASHQSTSSSSAAAPAVEKKKSNSAAALGVEKKKGKGLGDHERPSKQKKGGGALKTARMLALERSPMLGLTKNNLRVLALRHRISLLSSDAYAPLREIAAQAALVVMERALLYCADRAKVTSDDVVRAVELTSAERNRLSVIIPSSQ